MDAKYCGKELHSDQIEDSVLLDVLYEDNPYKNIQEKVLSHSFIASEGEPTIFRVHR